MLYLQAQSILTYFLEIPTQNLPRSILLSHNVYSMIRTLYRSRSCNLRRNNSNVRTDRSVSLWRKLINRQIVMSSVRVACCKVVVAMGGLKIASPQIVGSSIILLVDIVVILLHHDASVI